MMIRKNIRISIIAGSLIALFSVFFISCHQNKRTDLDTPSSGTIHISVDESFKPVIDSQIKVLKPCIPKPKSSPNISLKRNVLKI
jgi:phosphate transport system substrate-binding protein